MEWLNYQHLLYFWMVVREGGIVPASRVLRLAHPTISGQIKQLESVLDQQLFDRSGRRLKLTEVGKMTYRYADEIFTLGRELMQALKQQPAGRPLTLVVGITEQMPKLVARQLLRPALSLEDPVRLVVEEGQHDRLVAELALHNLDVVLADAPIPSGSHIKAFSHQLGECGISFVASKALARQFRGSFPQCLNGAPFIFPTHEAKLRRALEQWLDSNDIVVETVAEIADSALIKVLGQDGLGLFAVPGVIEEDVIQQYRMQVVGRTEEVKERFYALSVERRIRHPAVAAISEAARSSLFS
jgi:LysR family transcriptional activator of nhaA